MKGALLLLALAGAATGCLRKTSYRCESNEQCGAGGQCEASSYCSFTDADCTAGRRYSDLAGTNANKCVGEETDLDGGVDGLPDDVLLVDASPGCPISYMAISGQAHRYRVIANLAGWTNQAAACDADGAATYLAVPDTQVELTAILTASGGGDTWVGINDQQVEGTYVTSNGGTFAANDPLWDVGEPDDTPSTGNPQDGADCVAARDGKLSTERCISLYVAVCECDP